MVPSRPIWTLTLTGRCAFELTFGRNRTDSSDTGGRRENAMNAIRRAASAVVDTLESRRLLSGELDPTFGTGGKVLHDAPLIPTALAVRPDGKILFSGWGLSDAGSVVRLNADG